MYGDWRQYRRRVRGRVAKGKKMAVGAQCPACAVEDWVCADCGDSHLAWAALHISAMRGVQSITHSASEMAEAVAAR